MYNGETLKKDGKSVPASRLQRDMDRCHLTITISGEGHSGIEHKTGASQSSSSKASMAQEMKCFIQGIVGSECRNWTTATII